MASEREISYTISQPVSGPDITDACNELAELTADQEGVTLHHPEATDGSGLRLLFLAARESRSRLGLGPMAYEVFMQDPGTHAAVLERFDTTSTSRLMATGTIVDTYSSSSFARGIYLDLLPKDQRAVITQRKRICSGISVASVVSGIRQSKPNWGTHSNARIKLATIARETVDEETAWKWTEDLDKYFSTAVFLGHLNLAGRQPDSGRL